MKLNKNVSSDRSKTRKRHFSAPSHVRWGPQLCLAVIWLSWLQAPTDVRPAVQGVEDQVRGEVDACEEGWRGPGETHYVTMWTKHSPGLS